jgi:hypothetical protein
MWQDFLEEQRNRTEHRLHLAKFWKRDRKDMERLHADFYHKKSNLQRCEEERAEGEQTSYTCCTTCSSTFSADQYAATTLTRGKILITAHSFQFRTRFIH